MHLWNYRAANLLITAVFAVTAALFAFGTAAHAATESYAEGNSGTGTCANAVNAVTDNNARALCDDGEFVDLTTFNLTDIVPIGAEDISFTVRVAGRVTDNDATDVVRASLSWNGGTNFTSSIASASINSEPNAGDSIVTAPSSATCSNFGRTWSYPELVDGTFIVRVTADPSSSNQDIQIDDVDIRPCWAGRDVQNVQVNGSSSIDVDPDSTISVRVDVLHTDVAGLSSSSDNDWESTRWSIGGNSECVNHADFTTTGTDHTTFSANVPNSNGIFDVLVTAYEDDSCTSGTSAIFVLDDAVDTTGGVPSIGHSAFVEGSSATGTCVNSVFAVVDDNSRAICDDDEQVTLAGFDLDQLVPTTAEDISFIVRVAARSSDNDGVDVGRVSLSWNGGGNFTTVHNTASIEAESGDDSIVTAHSTGSCSLFGRLWTRAELTDANFRVRVQADTNDGDEQLSIDDVDVKLCWAGRLVDKVRVDGSSSTDVDPGDDVDVTVDVLHVDAPGVSNVDDNDWESTRWILGPNSSCMNHVDFTDSDTDQVTFTVPAPDSSGVYDLYITAYRDDACGTGASENFILDNAVDTRFGPPSPSPDPDNPSIACDGIPNDASFLWFLARGNPGMLHNFNRGHIPPGLLKSFVGRHNGWNWGDWDDFDCDDLEEWWDNDDDDDDHKHRGRRHHHDDHDDD